MLRWTIRLEGGPRRVNHAAVAIGDKIYSFGGYCTGEDYETTRPIDVHVLDAITYRWNIVHASRHDGAWQQTIPYQRYGHTCVAWDDKAFIWGGRNDRDGACNVLFCFDPATKTWTRPIVVGPVPGARDGHSACVIGDAMYVFGGYEEDEDRFSNEVHRFSFLTLTWSHIAVSGSPASWRDFHSASAVGGRYMIVFGGRSDYGAPFHTNHEFYCRRVHVFDTQTKQWSQPHVLGEGPAGRRSHSAFVHKDLVYIFGGYNGLEDKHFADLWCLDPYTFVWNKLTPRGGGGSSISSPTTTSARTPIVGPPAAPAGNADGGEADAVIAPVNDLVDANNGGGVVVAAAPTPAHRAPCARRRQCCCVVKDTVILFGGTSPAVEQVEDSEFNLMDHSDLYVLDFYPSLKTLCLIAVVDHKLDTTLLPRDLQWEILSMTTNSNISRPLTNNG